jgi:three-Cys-motif partner protein
MKNNFYKNQDNLTAAKIEFYQNYIEVYLIKLLTGFGECFVADLFCGAGKNGEKRGSPLILIDRANYILTRPQLKTAKLIILFNDSDKKCINDLENELKKIKNDVRIKIFLTNKFFLEAFNECITELKGKPIPKFFFLDPFKYSDIKVSHLKALMNLKNAEILLFLPVFHAFRFKTGDFKPDHKLRVFLEEFTDAGEKDYNNIDDFNEAIKEKLKKDLGVNFVRPVLLDDGARKNALFLITDNLGAAILMNKIAHKKSEDGKGVKIKDIKCGKRTLFGTEGTKKFQAFKNKIEEMLKNSKNISSHEIIYFTVDEGFLPKHAKEILEGFKKDNKIKIFDKLGRETKQFNIAENPKDVSFYRYVY